VAVIVHQPSPPMAGRAIEHGVVYVQNVILPEAQVWLSRFVVAVEHGANVEAVTRFVFHLIVPWKKTMHTDQWTNKISTHYLY
jgi:hypothetical protein